MLVVTFFFILFLGGATAAFLLMVLFFFVKGLVQGGIAYFRGRRNLKDMPDINP